MYNRINQLFHKAGFILALLTLFSVSISKAQNTGYVTIKQVKGDVQVKKNPKRVVVLDLGSLETCYELGIPVVGVLGNVQQFMPEYADATKYTAVGSVPKADVEKVAALKPDLIITSNRQKAQYDSLAAIAHTLVFATELDNFWPSLESNVNAVASIFDKQALAEQKLTTLRQKRDVVIAKANTEQGKSLFALHVNGRLTPSGPQSRFGFGYDVLGLNPAYIPAPSKEEATEAKGRYTGPSIQEINPDYLFIFDRNTGIKGQMPQLSEVINEDVKATKAYKNNKVFLLPGFTWYLSGSGLISVHNKITDIGTQLFGIQF